MTDRNTWVFSIQADELLEKSTQKVAHHKDRLKFWEGEQKAIREKYINSVREAAQEATEKEAREAEELALQIDYLETPLSGVRMSSNALPPRRKEIMGDAEIYEELQKALGKVNEHKAMVETFSRWELLFQRDPSAKFEMTYSDAMFFGF